jgi:hypothetical protein
MTYPKIPEDQYRHLLFTLRGQLDALWNSCKCYGLKEEVEGNIEQSIKLCEKFAMAVRGKEGDWRILNDKKPMVTEG